MKKQTGFTLIEVIVVISILAVLVGVAVPAFDGFRVNQGKQKTKQQFARIQEATELFLQMQLQQSPTQELGSTMDTLTFAGTGGKGLLEPDVLLGLPGYSCMSYWSPNEVTAANQWLDPWGNKVRFPGDFAPGDPDYGERSVIFMDPTDTAVMSKYRLEWMPVATEEGLYRQAVVNGALQEYFKTHSLGGFSVAATPYESFFFGGIGTDPTSFPPLNATVLNDDLRWVGSPTQGIFLEFEDLLGGNGPNYFRVKFTVQ